MFGLAFSASPEAGNVIKLRTLPQTTDKVRFTWLPLEGKLSAPRLTDEVETMALSKKLSAY